MLLGTSFSPPLPAICVCINRWLIRKTSALVSWWTPVLWWRESGLVLRWGIMTAAANW